MKQSDVTLYSVHIYYIILSKNEEDALARAYLRTVNARARNYLFCKVCEVE